MFVYAVKWVERGLGPLEYDLHEREHRRVDRHGVDIVTCAHDRMAHHYVQLARPSAKVERPRLLGPAEVK